MSSNALRRIDVVQLRAICSGCGVHELCLPTGLDQHELEQLESVISRKQALKGGEYLYRARSELQSLYAVRTGYLKSSMPRDDGREQVAGFHMAGEMLGMCAISSGRHICDAIALVDSEVCVIPYNELEQLSRDIPALQHHFHRIMSREITRDYGVMLLLGNMRAEERLAAFLLNLSQRFASRGYSPLRFRLQMNRKEIGSYLGLTLETISRTFSQFQDDGLVTVRGRSIEITDTKRLRVMIGHYSGR